MRELRKAGNRDAWHSLGGRTNVGQGADYTARVERCTRKDCRAQEEQWTKCRCLAGIETLQQMSKRLRMQCVRLLTNQKACLSTVSSGGVYIAPIMVPMEPTKLTPSTTHGFADMMRKVNPFLNMVRATKAVIASPPPVYWKLSCRYDRSAGESASRVSRLRNAFTPTIVPATAACQETLD